jgi:hypothetical protein
MSTQEGGEGFELETSASLSVNTVVYLQHKIIKLFLKPLKNGWVGKCLDKF